MLNQYLDGGAGKSMVIPPWRSSDVLSGPKTPLWACSCGVSTNWRCRIRCACGKSAPQSIVNAAKEEHRQNQERRAAAKTSSTRRERGGGTANRDSEVQRLSKQLQKLQKQLADRDAEKPLAGVSGNDGVGSAIVPQGGADAVKDRIAQLLEQRSLLAKDKAAEAWVQAIDVELADLRAQRRANQPMHIQQRDADAKARKLQTALEQTDADIEAAEKALQELREKRAGITTDLAAANAVVRELAASTVAQVPADDLLEALPWFKAVDLSDETTAGKVDALRNLLCDIQASAKQAPAKQPEAPAAAAPVTTTHLPDMDVDDNELEAEFTAAWASAKDAAASAPLDPNGGEPVQPDPALVFHEVVRKRRFGKTPASGSEAKTRRIDDEQGRDDRSRSPVGGRTSS